MGCGTEPFGTGSTFVITVQFSRELAEDDPVYSHFKDAVELLLPGQITMTPTKVNDLVVAAQVTVTGPLDPLIAPPFNRAFNRLMWGVQRRRPGNIDSRCTVTVTDRKLNTTPKNDRPWLFENT